MSKSMMLSFFYSVSRIAAGLLLHPYQTMQSLVKERIFIWLAVTPLYILVAITVGWKYAIVPMVQVLFSCGSEYYVACDLLTFISNTIVFFCLYWQLLLLYLLVRFRLLL